MESNVTLKSNVVLIQKIRKLWKFEMITVKGDPNFKWYFFWNYKVLFRV